MVAPLSPAINPSSIIAIPLSSSSIIVCGRPSWFFVEILELLLPSANTRPSGVPITHLRVRMWVYHNPGYIPSFVVGVVVCRRVSALSQSSLLRL